MDAGQESSFGSRRRSRIDQMVLEAEEADVEDEVSEDKNSRGTKRKLENVTNTGGGEGGIKTEEGPARKRALTSSLQQTKRVSSQAVRTVLQTMTQQRLLLHCNNITLQAARNILEGQAIHPLLCYNQLKTSVAGFIATITCSFTPSLNAENTEGDFLYYVPDDLPASSLASSSADGGDGLSKSQSDYTYFDPRSDQPVACVSSVMCTCGNVRSGSWCPHVVAVILHCQQHPESMASYEEVAQSISTLNKKQLRSLVLHQLVLVPSRVSALMGLVEMLNRGETLVLPSPDEGMSSLTSSSGGSVGSNRPSSPSLLSASSTGSSSSILVSAMSASGQQATTPFVPPEVAGGMASMPTKLTVDMLAIKRKLAVAFMNWEASKEAPSSCDGECKSSRYYGSCSCSDLEPEPDFGTVESAIKTILTECQNLWENRSHFDALSMLFCTTEELTLRISLDDDDDSDWDDVDETVSMYRASDVVKAINTVWVKFMVSFPFVEVDRAIWVEKLRTLKPIGGLPTEIRDLYAPAIEAGVSGWTDVLKLFEAKKEELERQDIDIDEDEDIEEEDKLIVKRNSNGSLEIDLTLEGQGKDKKSPSSSSEKGKEKATDEDEGAKDKGKEKAIDISDEDGEGKGKEKDFQFAESQEVTQARLAYLQEHGYFKEALLLMKYAKQLKGKELVLLHMGKVNEAVSFALSHVKNAESLYELSILLIDSHPYASFEICSKAVAQLASASEGARDPFFHLSREQYNNNPALFAMKFFTNYLLGAGFPQGRFENDQLQLKLLDLLFLLTGTPVPSFTTGEESSHRRHPYEALVERKERERQQELAEERKENDKEKGKEKEKEAEDERKDKSISGVPRLTQLCTIRIAAYFSTLEEGGAGSSLTVPLQRYSLLSGTPSHILKPIMLESAVYHLAERLKREHTALESMFAYGERVLFAVLDKSMHASRVIMDALSTFAKNNNMTGRFFSVVERLYSERWFMFSLEFALDCLAKFPRDGHTGPSSSGDYWNYNRGLPCQPIRIIEWILEFFFGYEGETETASATANAYSPYAGTIRKQQADKKRKDESA